MSFKVKSVYEYTSPHEDDLHFPAGVIITVNDTEDPDWYGGEYVDDDGHKKEGIFPRNFVEKYEPVAPPRPTRTRAKKEPEAVNLPTEPAEAEQRVEEPTVASRTLSDTAPSTREQGAGADEDNTTHVAAPTRDEPSSPTISSPPRTAPAATNPTNAAQITSTKPTSTSVQATEAISPPNAASAKRSPPPVTEKPSSFRDRIAAFNKTAAPPIAPFKPGGLGSGNSGFIKKPFVAPPPSGNTYVPTQPSIPVAKVYRRDEDPEIKEREAEDLENAQRAGLIPTEAQDGEEDQPKPTSLKERIALLQKQQQEQAQRHSEAVAKKEKPKRPTKPRTISHDAAEEEPEQVAAAPPPLPPPRQDTEEMADTSSADDTRPPRPPPQLRRRSSRGGVNRDGNEADLSGAGETTEGPEELTEKEESEDNRRALPIRQPEKVEPDVGDEEDETGDDEEEEEVDPEVRRKEELRARMAKMSGGAGMHGIFGGGMPLPGAAAPAKKKKSSAIPVSTQEPMSTTAPPVPTMMALPGMGQNSRVPLPRREERQNAEDAASDAPQVVGNDEAAPAGVASLAREPPSVSKRDSAGAPPPPVPGGRPAPPPIPTDARPPPPLSMPSEIIKSPSEGSESGDELSGNDAPLETPRAEVPSSRAPPLPPVTIPKSPEMRAADNVRSPTSPQFSQSAKRNSRLPPPIPTSAPLSPPFQARPPPPPPPSGLSRSSTADTPISPPAIPSQAFDRADEDGEGEVTEYEADYDTDIATGQTHKDALASHGRESSFEDNRSVKSPVAASQASFAPPIPSAPPPKMVPPPPPVPSEPPPDSRPIRKSTDRPTGVPPPLPPSKESTTPWSEKDYDPFNSNTQPPSLGELSGVTQAPSGSRQVSDNTAQPQEATSFLSSSSARNPPTPGTAARPSFDALRSDRGVRRSVDVSRPGAESGFVASDIDLGGQTAWWLNKDSLPPQLQGRKDIVFESEESQSAQRGGKTTVTRDIYILFQDYSQTVITARFDPQNASDVHLEQRHEAPPRALRQDQLEQAYERFGRSIAEAISSKKDSVVGDGTPQALVFELLKPHKEALLPIGTRAFGALVYANLANASHTQHDEIRPGDIISIRNAKFQGKHGPMHAKYSVEVGKPDHVGVVGEWDGTKKKVRAWEQGRENKKVKLESYKFDDLRSGEVKIWRVMPRSWVGWEGTN